MGKKKLTLEQCSHPMSRKTQALAKQLKRGTKLAKSKQESFLKRNLFGEKVLWFKEQLDENTKYCTAEQIKELILKYINRFDEELEQINLKHTVGVRQNRQHASREDVIKMTVEREMNEFNTCGYEIPDLMNGKNVEVLKNWNGEMRFLQNIKCRRFSKKFLERNKSNNSKAMDVDETQS